MSLMEQVVLDASPLIYLAKLDALDVLPHAGRIGVVPTSVWDEVARPALSFRFPEVASLELGRTTGWITMTTLTEAEASSVATLGERLPGLHAGELGCLAIAQARGHPICLHERQASRLARTLGIRTIHLAELLFDGTPDRGALEVRVRRFARMTNLSMTDLDELLGIIGETRP